MGEYGALAHKRENAPQAFRLTRRLGKEAGGDVLSHRVPPAVPSALWGLTTVFGMGTGVSPTPKPPAKSRGSVKNKSFEGRKASQVLLKVFEAYSDCFHGTPAEWGAGQASRAISTARLHVLPRFHLLPINVLVSHGPPESLRSGSVHLEGGFPLRCFQRLSLPDVATRRCPWRDNRYTRGQSVPVLSY